MPPGNIRTVRVKQYSEQLWIRIQIHVIHGCRTRQALLAHNQCANETTAITL